MLSQMSEFIIVDERKQRPRPRPRKKKPTTTRWSSLPTDLWLQILSKLNFADGIRFRCACKNWRSLPFYHIRYPIDSKLPWFLSFRWDKSRSQIQFQLFDEFHKQRPYTSFAVMRKEGEGERDVGKWSLRYLGWKQRWVFFSLKNKDTSLTSLFLLSPLTRQIVTLPDFGSSLHKPFHIKQITFSSDPTSNKCVFFLLVNCEHSLSEEFFDCSDYSDRVETYQPGQQGWSTMAVSPYPRRNYKQMLYFRGNLFFVSAKFASIFMDWYDAAAGKWRVFHLPFAGHMDHHLLESDGEMLLVCFDRGAGACQICTYTPTFWTVKERVYGGYVGCGYIDNLISFPTALEETRCLESKLIFNDPRTNMGRFVHLTQDLKGFVYERVFVKQNSGRGVWFECRLD